MSHVPTAELAAPSGGNPEPRPCFSRKIASSSPTHEAGGGFGTGLCLAEGGMSSSGGAGECGGSSASSQHRSVLFLSTAILIQNATGAESLRGNFRAAEEHGLDVLYTVNLPHSPPRVPCATLSALPHSSLCPTVSTVGMLRSCPCPWWGGWNQMVPKAPSYPNHSEIL